MATFADRVLALIAVIGSDVKTLTTSIGTKLNKTDARQPFTYTVSGTVVEGQGVTPITLSGAWVLDSVTLAITTAPTGRSLIVDVNKGTGAGAATTIFGTAANKPTITAGSTRDFSPSTDASVTIFASGDYLTIDIDQAGSTVPGSDLTVTVWLRPA
jgi:hypothetical protein